ncbi:hypothetical protein H6G96_13115 [Nostoc sp. FACHB-892]|uniref:hypothetical protein n=1 Tax=Nostoc sp. FACHB-892 TaxID=2692843 RepID=UPI001683900D|nr:hypothetical protein [Nostoc sp. FACHB-892]MBD2727242.1 hypothetical protein [Nostoc sp. FACHB-892]
MILISDRFSVLWQIGLDAIAQHRREEACCQTVIATKRANVTDVPDVPDNIPDLSLVYFNEINCDCLATELDNPIY